MICRKIIYNTELNELVNYLHDSKKRIVFTNGSFDILHRGHITYLNKARELGDVLVVGINTDESIRQYKSTDRPINTLEDRAELLSALEMIDYIIPFNETVPLKLIEKIKPDIYVKGGDYTINELPEAKIIDKQGGTVKLIPYEDGYSTTGIINTILEKYAAK